MNGAAGAVDMEGAADMELPGVEAEAEAEPEKMEVGLLKDLVIVCLEFSDIGARFLVCRLRGFVVE